MSLKLLSSHGLLEKVAVSKKQVTSNVIRAKKDLITAKATITIDEEWAYTIAYHAMLRAGRALMLPRDSSQRSAGGLKKNSRQKDCLNHRQLCPP